MQPSARPIDAPGLRAAWERFTAGGGLAAELDPLIAGSWRRCAARLDPRAGPRWAYAGSARTALRAAQQGFLGMVARPVLEDICQFIEGSGALLVLADPAACVVEMLGDPDLGAEARALGFRPGAFLDEGRIGSNAFSLALLEGIPVQVLGAEHYLLAFHDWYSAAAPMHDPAGRPIGIIGLLQRRPERMPQSLGVVFAAARAVENQLQAEHIIREANEQATEFNATLDAVSEGILAWTTQGIVTHLNGQGGRLLGIKPSLVVGRPLHDHIVLSEGITRAAAGGEELNDVEAAFKVDGGKQECSASLRVIRNRGGDPEAFILTLRPIAQVHQLVNRMLGSQARMTLADIIGQSPAAQRMRRQSLAAVHSPGSVLLAGEAGAGQNVLARAIHNSGPRAAGPFLSINCRAIPRELVLEEFLGFEGALDSGAMTGQPSKFELAGGGTLFLEELEALPLEMQSILARVLRSGEVARLGGKRSIRVDARVIASCGPRLEERLRTGAFRADLFEQVNLCAIELPPLRERAEDIPALIGRSLGLLPGPAPGVSAAARALLCAYPWPGNLAELDAVLELASSRAEGAAIEPQHLPEGLREGARPGGAPVRTIRELERAAIANALRAARGNHSKAALSLSISRNTLYRKIKEMGLAPER